MTMGNKPLEFDEQQLLKDITKLGHRYFSLVNWMMDYCTTKLGFKMWYNYIGKDLKVHCQQSTEATTKHGKTRKTSTDTKITGLQSSIRTNQEVGGSKFASFELNLFMSNMKLKVITMKGNIL
jgi:hypothetical protein